MFLLLAAGGAAPLAFAQGGRISGTVADAESGEPVAGVQVSVEGTGLGAVTGERGTFTLANVPAGPRTIAFTRLGYDTARQGVRVDPAGTATLAVRLTPGFIELDEVVVVAGSRRPERIVEAPASVSVITREEIRREGHHGQLPRLLLNEPGIDVVQSDLQDFNVNARGLNSALNRRVLVLHDGIDRSIGLLHAQAWEALSRPLDDLARVEMVRGPGSALYGANAFSGVIDVRTPAPGDMVGNRIAVAGGLPGDGRVDVRHAGVSADERWGYKSNVGYSAAGETFAEPRTRADARGECPPQASECTFDYGPLPVEEVRFDEGAVTALFGSARLDRNFDDGSVLTLEAGATRIRNQLHVTELGRVQVEGEFPWARVNYATRRWNAMAWWDSRRDSENVLLSNGAPAIPLDDKFHVEVQGNWSAAGERLRLVAGASNRWTSVDTRGTLLEEPHDDTITSAYGQLALELHPRLEGVVAARFDHFTVIEADRLSPKAALVFKPYQNHSLRLTYNRAYQTPNYAELFLNVAPRPPIPLDRVERGLEQRLSEAAGRPIDLPLGFGLTPLRARGNAGLEVEQLTGYEAGYKGVFLDGRVFATLDLYENRIEDLITDLLPRVNPAFRPFELPPQFATPELAPFAPLVLDVLRNDPLLGPIFPLLSILPDGTLEYVLSYGNAADVEERGLEVAISFLPAPRWELSANYSLFDFDVDQATVAPRDRLLANTPRHKANLGIAYHDPGFFDVGINVHVQDGFDWAGGVFAGRVPGYALVDLFAGWRWNARTRLNVAWTNVLDRDHYELYGGSVIGSRAVAGASLTF